MSLISDLQNVQRQHLMLAISLFGGTVAPGFLILLHFKPKLVAEYDFFKVVLFSVGAYGSASVCNLFAEIEFWP